MHVHVHVFVYVPLHASDSLKFWLRDVLLCRAGIVSSPHIHCRGVLVHVADT